VQIMPRYEVTFVDGKSVVKDAPDGTEAKRQAKAERTRECPPDTPRSAPEVKVARVTPLER